ncbi:MAG: hypothetical protein AAF721_06555 [Myxococcota bacterium]
MRISGAGLVGLALIAACGDDVGPPVASGTTGDMSTSSGDGTPASSGPGPLDSGSSSDDESSETGETMPQPPACGSRDYDWAPMLPGPAQDTFDSGLERIARRHDRLHTAITSAPTGLAGDVVVLTRNTAGREAVQTFLDEDDAWDFAAVTGLGLRDAVSAWNKATGAFAGVAVAADAYRYGVLRDQGYPCAEVDRARDQLLRAIDGLHLATALTGEPGLVIRAVAHREWPGSEQIETTPLFDRDGNPLPLEKNNGTWREDLSGEHPELVWEDSCSRDQLIGWAAGFGAVWEVIATDPTIDDARKLRLQADAQAIVMQLSTVRPSGYDLEIWDPEGRPSFHGHLHERNLEGSYVGLLNGFHAAMAAGIIGALTYAAEDMQSANYLYGALIDERDLPRIAAQSTLVDFGAATNYSTYNMGFDAAWLASRYLDHGEAREHLQTFTRELYASPDAPRQPIENAQSFFDFVAAATEADASAFAAAPGAPNSDWLAQGLDTLSRFPEPPSYIVSVENCDADEIEAGVCTLLDGTVTELIEGVAHNDELVAADPVPVEVRPRSNFDWRSNPYRVNVSSSGQVLPSSADFRFAYWLGRWTRVD